MVSSVVAGPVIRFKYSIGLLVTLIVPVDPVEHIIDLCLIVGCIFNRHVKLLNGPVQVRHQSHLGLVI